MTRRIIESLRNDLVALRAADAIVQKSMHEFDMICPPPVRAFSAAQIKHLRQSLRLSQPVLAKHIHITPSTVRRWEQGESRASGLALKLLNIIADKGLQAIL